MSREMKDSGIIDGLKIPSHWEVRKFGQICSVITDFVASGSFADLRENVKYLDEPDYAMLVRAADLSNSSKEKKCVYISESSYNFLCNSNLFGGEIILPNIGSIGDVYIVPKELYSHMSLAPNSIMFKTKEEDRYYYYYYQSKIGYVQLQTISESTAMPKFNKTDLRQLKILVPPLAEQQAIADFLDKKCNEIDELVSLQEKMIEELKAYKQSVITEAVCKGLKHSVPMKDSGIEWVGKMPIHWEIRRLKYIGKSENGLTYSPNDICDNSNGGILVLRSSNIQGGKLSFHDNVYVNSAPSSLHVKKGDIILCSRNGSAALVGKSAIVESDIYATFGAFMMRFRSNHHAQYINYLLTAAISKYKQLFSTTTINQLTISVFGNLEMPFVISRFEQQEIADYLDKKCSEIDQLIAIKQQKIVELKDYKKSLIYEYTTGKKEVKL